MDMRTTSSWLRRSYPGKRSAIPKTRQSNLRKNLLRESRRTTRTIQNAPRGPPNTSPTSRMSNPSRNRGVSRTIPTTAPARALRATLYSFGSICVEGFGICKGPAIESNVNAIAAMERSSVTEPSLIADIHVELNNSLLRSDRVLV